MTEWGNPTYPDWLWESAVDLGLIAGDPNYYKNGEATGHEYINAVMHSLIALATGNIEEPAPPPEPEPPTVEIGPIDNWYGHAPLVIENKIIRAPEGAAFAVRGHPDHDVTLKNCIVYGGEDGLKNNVNTEDSIVYLNYATGHGDCVQIENRCDVYHLRTQFYAYRRPVDIGTDRYGNACFQIQSSSPGEGAQMKVTFDQCRFDGGNYHGGAFDQGGGMPTVDVINSTATYNCRYPNIAFRDVRRLEVETV